MYVIMSTFIENQKKTYPIKFIHLLNLFLNNKPYNNDFTIDILNESDNSSSIRKLNSHNDIELLSSKMKNSLLICIFT